ncbi:MAG: winged helix-turn-helix transcriptional regulator [Thermoplasmata archaeon]|nr:winged helix-turn-helix transcriptional regulator [Thermoplasmata archaeon]
MTGRPLRDLKRNTELLILIEVIDSPSARLKDIADKLDVTVQAVSQYIGAMRKEGLVREQKGMMRPTRKGMQLLQEHFTTLKQEVDDALRMISVIDTCVAIAGAAVEQGQPVGLVMEDGMLMAYPGRKESSMGVAKEVASEGDDVLIGDLEGIVDMDLGELLLVEAPSEFDGGSKGVDVPKISERLESFSPGLLVAGDPVGSSLLMKTSGELFTIHAPVEATMSALSKGVDVAFCGTKESTDRMLDAVNALKAGMGYEVKWKLYRA